MAAVLLVCFFDAFCVAAKADDKITELEEKLERAKAEKEETEQSISDSKEELEVLTGTATTLKGTLDKLTTEMTRIRDNISRIEDRIKLKSDEIASMEKDLEEAVLVEEEQYEAMKKRIQYLYEKKDYSAYDSLLGNDSFSDMLNTNNYFEALTSYDRKKLEEYKRTRRVIEETKEYLSADQDELNELMQNALDEEERVSELLERTSSSIQKYDDEIASTEQEIADSEQELVSQQENIATLQKQIEEEKRLSELAASSAWRNIGDISYASTDRALLANLIYCEAGNQSYEGQLAVGAVVMNRVMSEVFPDTIVGVIYQSGQFTPARSGRLALALSNNSAPESCYMAADAAMAGQSNVGNCLFFRSASSGISGIQIGSHVFY